MGQRRRPSVPQVSSSRPSARVTKPTESARRPGRKATSRPVARSHRRAPSSMPTASSPSRVDAALAIPAPPGPQAADERTVLPAVLDLHAAEPRRRARRTRTRHRPRLNRTWPISAGQLTSGRPVSRRPTAGSCRLPNWSPGGRRRGGTPSRSPPGRGPPGWPGRVDRPCPRSGPGPWAPRIRSPAAGRPGCQAREQTGPSSSAGSSDNFAPDSVSQTSTTAASLPVADRQPPAVRVDREGAREPSPARSDRISRPVRRVPHADRAVGPDGHEPAAVLAESIRRGRAGAPGRLARPPSTPQSWKLSRRRSRPRIGRPG